MSNQRAIINVVPNENIRDPKMRFEDLLRRFGKIFQDSGIPSMLKEREAFESPSAIRHRKAKTLQRKIEQTKKEQKCKKQ